MRIIQILTVSLMGLLLAFTAMIASPNNVNANVGVLAIDEEGPRKLATVEGVIKAVDPANNTFILATKAGNVEGEAKVTVTLKTEYWLDNKPATMDKAMIVGNSATVTHLGGMAVKVQVVSKPL